MVCQIIGLEDFLEIYINVFLEVCEFCDVKGFYEKVRVGQIKGFIGIDVFYEFFFYLVFEIKIDEQFLEESVEVVFQFLKLYIELFKV